MRLLRLLLSGCRLALAATRSRDARGGSRAHASGGIWTWSAGTPWKSSQARSGARTLRTWTAPQVTPRNAAPGACRWARSQADPPRSVRRIGVSGRRRPSEARRAECDLRRPRARTPAG
jgi:hypothetical protein